ncbi:hypothetical protein [Xanthobacter autotrophicus]|uniref:hypothetical protein n=1 Tax=Xanthobacter autotrophicus TaxID=280 RepID=UPI003727E15B
MGDRLGPIHAACIRSFVRHGHDVVLHSYGRPVDTPDGVTLFDAAALMTQQELIRHRPTGSPALGANRYRYRLLKAGMGIYVDCDVFCLQPFPDEPYLFGLEQNGQVNNAVLAMPPDSKLLQDLVSATEDDYFIPPWVRRSDRRVWRLRKAMGFPRHVADQPWGTFGPQLVTYMIQKHHLMKMAQPIDIFYPLHHQQTSLLAQAGLRIADMVTPRTLGLHLYNHSLKGLEPVDGSPLHEVIQS